MQEGSLDGILFSSLVVLRVNILKEFIMLLMQEQENSLLLLSLSTEIMENFSIDLRSRERRLMTTLEPM